MPKNILVFAGNFVYTMFGNYACLDYDKRGEDEDKLWGTGKETSNNAKSNKRLKMKTSSNTCELDDHCSHSYSADENINEFTKMFLKTDVCTNCTYYPRYIVKNCQFILFSNSLQLT